MSNLKIKKGVTIIEVVIVTLILALVVALGTMLTSNLNTIASPKLGNRLFLQMEGRKLADRILESIRKSSDVIKPGIGETTPYLLVRDAENQVIYYYLDSDKINSEKYKKKLYELKSFVHSYDKTMQGKVSRFGNCIEKISFTGISPNCVQLNVRVSNDENSFQFLSQAGLMSLGDSDI